MVFQQDLMRFQSSNPPSFWSNKKTHQKRKGETHETNTFPIHFPEILRAILQGNPSLFGTETSCAGFSCVRVSQWEQTRHVHGVGGWRDFFLDSWGNDGSKFLHWLREYLCVFMLYHGSHPPQVVPKKSSKSFTNLDFCERYEAGPLLKGKQRFSPPRIRKNITSSPKFRQDFFGTKKTPLWSHPKRGVLKRQPNFRRKNPAKWRERNKRRDLWSPLGRIGKGISPSDRHTWDSKHQKNWRKVWISNIKGHHITSYWKKKPSTCTW